MSEDWLKEFEKWNQELIQKLESEELKNKYREWGKLGGRPKKEKVKSKKITIRVTEKEKEILQKKADKVGLSLAEFVRRSSLEIPLPDAERNKTLVEYRTNFKRLANHFRSGVWSDEEKKVFTDILKNTIKGIEKAMGI